MQNDSGSWVGTEDTVLVDLAIAGNNAAFSELIERHRAPCTNLAYSILRNRTDADDEVQNACWKAYVHLDQFQRDAKFSTWLTRIVVNQCLMRIRQMRRAKLVYVGDTPSEDAIRTEFRDSQATPEQVLGSLEISGVVRREIRRIPPLLRNVFVLRDVEELPIDEVAEVLGISVAAAKSRLLRARQELRIRLAKHCGRMGPATLLAATR